MNYAIITGAGNGERFGNKDKAFLEICGKPILLITLEKFLKNPLIDSIIVVCRKDQMEYVKSLCTEVIIVEGGNTRQESVYNALKALELSSEDAVIVHDAVRPFFSENLIEKTLNSCVSFSGGISAVSATDTIKSNVIGTDIVEKTLNRITLWNVQTPQAFRADILIKAYETAMSDGFYGTDDSMLVERIGGKVQLITGNRDNIKITVPSDLVLAEAIFKRSI